MPSNSAVSICNMALTQLGEDVITSLSDSNENARRCNTLYDPYRQGLLREYRWKFAGSRASLAADVTAPVWGYANRYLLPPDALQLRAINNRRRQGFSGIHYSIQGRYIVTDQAAPLEILYTADITDTTKFDSLFVLALAKRLEHVLFKAVSEGGVSERQAIFTEFLGLIAQAKSADAIERSELDVDSGSWISIREFAGGVEDNTLLHGFFA